MSAIDKVMYVFPGQGSQYPGMGQDLYHGFETAKEIFEQANDILNYDLVRIAFTDPDSQIGLTRYTQPILLTHQIACFRVFQELTNSKITPVLSTGHSFGEYTALIVDGVLSFENFKGLIKGTSAPNFFPILAIVAESVLRITSVSFFDFKAEFIVQAINGFPQSLVMFFCLMPLDPLLAKIKPKILLLYFKFLSIIILKIFFFAKLCQELEREKGIEPST